ncbi:hypothetical protein BJP25_20920 [Actinokineospora bangkokensis]|uniref:Uncharacterized protein n=1 Tax=Actinokineospora bangkokensis TaxID=1193682 RepID=A0A1Q9LKL9_9PSEU|nr:hypothetical protein BJP25_20920 [Actinokineospora bangkokensis]
MAGVAVVAALASGCSSGGGPVRAAADLLQVRVDKGVAIGGPEARVPEEDGAVDSPRLAARVDKVRVERELTTFNAMAVGLDDSHGYTAADGHEFLLASVLRERLPGSASTDEQPGPDGVAVVVGDKRAPVDLDEWEAGPQGFAVVASVPVGQPVWLEVSDIGRTIRYDLREHAYATDADSRRAEFYRGGLRIAPGQVLEATGSGSLEGASGGLEGAGVGFTLTVYSASKDLYAEGRQLGWAPDGSAWLTVRAGVQYVPAPNTFSLVQPEPGRESFTLGSDRPVSLEVDDASSGTTVEMVFKVADDLTSAVLRHTPAQSVTVKQAGEERAYPLRGARDVDAVLRLTAGRR